MFQFPVKCDIAGDGGVTLGMGCDITKCKVFIISYLNDKSYVYNDIKEQ